MCRLQKSEADNDLWLSGHFSTAAASKLESALGVSNRRLHIAERLPFCEFGVSTDLLYNLRPVLLIKPVSLKKMG